MIDLQKRDSANSRYAPGAVYVSAPHMRYGQLIKEAFGQSERGPGVEPVVILSIQNTDSITLTAKRMNVRSRYADSLQTITFPLPSTDAEVRERVEAFASRWFDLMDPIVGNLVLPADASMHGAGADPLQQLIAFYVLKFHKMPPMKVLAIIGAQPLETGQMSDIQLRDVNGKLRVCLPGLLAEPLGLNPLQTTVYLLFLRHPEGIVLSYISDYTAELCEIYGVIRSNTQHEQVENTINNLCDPLNGTLHQQLSRIKRCLVNVLKNRRIAEVYAIQGRHGRPYGVTGVASGEVVFHQPAWLRAIPLTICKNS